MYQKESDKQKERIQKLIDTGADSHDISKQVRGGNVEFAV
jgi:hypothetical protein